MRQDGEMTADFHLDHVQVLSQQPEELALFYAAATQGSLTGIGDDLWLCEGPARRVLVGKGPSNTLGLGGYACADEESLAAKRNHIARHGIEIQSAISPLFSGRDAFAVTDADGNRIEFSTVGDAPAGNQTPSLAGRLQHVVVASSDIDGLLPFYTDALGFHLSDRVQDEAENATACFLRSDTEHHSFAVFGAPKNRLDHHSYETNDWNGIRDWADHLAAMNVELAWGPGRHGPGNNLFLMFDDIDGNKIEVSAEIETIDDDRPAGLWEHSERTLNLWGRGLLRK
jgi:catechol 2,3-dioxygenase